MKAQTMKMLTVHFASLFMFICLNYSQKSKLLHFAIFLFVGWDGARARTRLTCGQREKISDAGDMQNRRELDLERYEESVVRNIVCTRIYRGT